MASRKDDNKAGRILRIVNYCNSQILNVNEYTLIRTIFSHILENNRIESIEQLANEASTSQASVSRFIKKIGYSSFSEFRFQYVSEFSQLYKFRKSEHESYMEKETSIIDIEYTKALQNLENTKKILDESKIQNIVQILTNADSVTILGDDHCLSDFYTLQLNLMASGIPAFLFKNEEMQTLHAKSLHEGDVVIYLNVARQFLTPPHRKLLTELRQNSVCLIGIVQDRMLESLFDHCLLYGIEGSFNYGFYSLWYLSQVLSEMVIDEQ